MSAAQTTQKIIIVLSSPNDWDEWIEIIKSKAIGGDVWDYMNPSTIRDALPALMRTTMPMPKDVNPAHATVTDLSAAEQDELKVLRANFKLESAVYERRRIALASMRSYIQENITRTYL